MIHWWCHSLLLAGAVFAAAPATAQQTVATDRTVDRHAADLLARPITIRLDRTSIRQAIASIAAAARVQLLYQTETFARLDAPVTLHATRMPLGEALNKVLMGTRLQAVSAGEDVISIETVARNARSGRGTPLHSRNSRISP